MQKLSLRNWKQSHGSPKQQKILQFLRQLPPLGPGLKNSCAVVCWHENSCFWKMWRLSCLRGIPQITRIQSIWNSHPQARLLKTETCSPRLFGGPVLVCIIALPCRSRGLPTYRQPKTDHRILIGWGSFIQMCWVSADEGPEVASHLYSLKYTRFPWAYSSNLNQLLQFKPVVLVSHLFVFFGASNLPSQEKSCHNKERWPSSPQIFKVP